MMPFHSTFTILYMPCELYVFRFCLDFIHRNASVPSIPFCCSFLQFILLIPLVSITMLFQHSAIFCCFSLLLLTPPLLVFSAPHAVILSLLCCYSIPLMLLLISLPCSCNPSYASILFLSNQNSIPPMLLFHPSHASIPFLLCCCPALPFQLFHSSNVAVPSLTCSYSISPMLFYCILHMMIFAMFLNPCYFFIAH